jgi:hypothetical protein
MASKTGHLYVYLRSLRAAAASGDILGLWSVILELMNDAYFEDWQLPMSTSSSVIGWKVIAWSVLLVV